METRLVRRILADPNHRLGGGWRVS